MRARRVFGQTNPVQICDINIEARPFVRSFVHARVHASRARRHAPVGLEHHSSSVSALRIRASVRSSVDAASRCARALCVHELDARIFLEVEQTFFLESRTVNSTGGRVRHMDRATRASS